MRKLPHLGPFCQVFYVYLKMGLSWHQAGLVNYVARWNESGKECFTAVETIATELFLTYRTMRRVVDRCIAEDILTATPVPKSRARILKITDSFVSRVELALAEEAKGPSVQFVTEGVHSVQDGVQFVRPSVQFVQDGVQNGQLPRSIPRSNDLNIDLNTDLKLLSDLGVQNGQMVQKSVSADPAIDKDEYQAFKKQLLNRVK